MKRLCIVVVCGLVLGAASFWFWRSREPSVSLAARPITVLRLVDYGPHSQSSKMYDENVAEQRVLGAEAAERVAAALGNEANFSGHGARCFSPGMGFRFGDGPDAQHALICLNCRKIGFVRGEGWVVRGLTNDGLREFREIYEGLFASASQPATATTRDRS
jgi:hypothetical protein